MSYVEKLIDAFGGVRPMARAIGRAPATVHGWRKRATVPDHEKVRVWRTAGSLGVDLSPLDFLPTPFLHEPVDRDDVTQNERAAQ